jgi:pimeloyl-ACP methyl ester carboxylesterase
MTRTTAFLLCLLATASSFGQELRRAGFLGLQVIAPSDAEREQAAVPAGIGVKVGTVLESGSGKAAGIQTNDIITRIDGHDVTGPDSFVRFVRGLHGGDVAAIEFHRGRETRSSRMLVKPRPYEQATDVKVDYRSVAAGDGTLRRAIVTSPRQEGKFPAVLYLTGIGCFSQESLDVSTTEAKLLYGLTRRGFVTMRVEKSGIGDSEGPPCDSPAADLNGEVSSYRAALRALRQLPSVDPENVFVMGLSIGGVEAPLVASQERVKGLVVVNTVAKPLIEYLLEIRRKQMALRHEPFDAIDRAMRLDELCNHRLLIEKQSVDHIVSEIAACREHIEYPAPSSFMQQWAALDIAGLWKEIATPVLIVYGTSDFIAGVDDQPYLAAMIDSFHPGQATLQPIPGMDHYLTKAVSMEASMAGKRGVSGEFEPAALEAIGNWIQKTAKKPGV